MTVDMISPVESAPPVLPQGPQPDVLLRLLPSGVAVVSTAPLGGSDEGPARRLVQGAGEAQGLDEGRVELKGNELSLRSRAATLRSGIAYCTADRKRDGIFAERPIRENLSSPWVRAVSSAGWISGRRERLRSREIAAEFAIDVKRLGAAVGALSGGNQQKVAVGKWLGTEPRVILLEEPTRGVDIGARAEIYQRLRDLCSAGVGIVVASSDTSEILGLSDTIATFYRGRMIRVLPHDEWTEDALVREVMHQEGETQANGGGAAS